MKKKEFCWALAVVVLSLGLSVLLHAPSSAELADQPVSAAVAVPAAVATVLAAGSLPDCRDLEGQACSGAVRFVRCQWQPMEPGVCVCSGGTLHCG